MENEGTVSRKLMLVCTECGFEWERGMPCAHNCYAVLRKNRLGLIIELRRNRSAFEALLTNLSPVTEVGLCNLITETIAGIDRTLKDCCLASEENEVLRKTAS